MPRKHLFPLVVLLAAASVAGLLALGRAVDLGRPAGASTGRQPAIAFRLARLDKAEKSLRTQLADLRKTPAPGPRTWPFLTEAALGIATSTKLPSSPGSRFRSVIQAP